MATIFTTILNMSLTACIIILIVLLARQCLKKVPKIFSYVLWSVVLFRLLCPISISLPVSILAPMSGASTSAGTSYTASMEYISVPERNESEQTQQSVPGENAAQSNTIGTEQELSTAPVITPITPTAPEADTPTTVVEQKMSASEIVLTVLGWVWVAGMVGVLGMTAWQTITLKRRLADAFIIRGNIFESDKIDTAFILGIINPKIYLPLGLPFDVQKAVVAHEQTHQRRGDHIVKLVSYIALAIHWFNPLVWLSFKLMCDDMEKSCDEAVIRTMNSRGYTEKSVKKAYSEMLFALGGGKQHMFSPVSFAEHSVKERIINVAKFKRIGGVFAVALGAVCIAIVGICIVNPDNTTLAAYSGMDFIEAQKHSADAVKLTIGDITFWSDDTELDLSGQHIDDFSPLTQCTQLVSLDISETGVTDLSFLSSLYGLQKLDISNNAERVVTTGPEQKNQIKNIENENIIGNLTNLRSLNISGNGIENISFVTQLSSLEHLDISRNYISDISCLESNASLKRLYIYGNKFENAVFPSGLAALEELCAEGCTFTDYMGLADCIEMRILDLQNTGRNGYIHDLSLLSDMSKLEYLNLKECYDIDLNPLSSLTSLEELYLDFSTSGEDGYKFFSEMDKLRILDIYVDHTYDLSGFSALTNLERLNLTGAGDISPIAECKNLNQIILSFGDVDDANISALSELSKLQYLDLSGNTYLHDVSSLHTLKELVYLNLSSCNISDISALSSMDKLIYLNIESNNIEDVSPLFYLDGFSNSENIDGKGYVMHYPEQDFEILHPEIYLIGNPVTEEQIAQLRSKVVCSVYSEWLE